MTNPVDEVRRAADFGQIVAEVTELKPVGKRLVGRCPFHEGAEPTLAVHTEEKRYVCLECDANGDLFSFVRNCTASTTTPRSSGSRRGPPPDSAPTEPAPAQR